jgi:hypothetical protein
MATVVGSFVRSSNTDAKASTPEPVCALIFA